MFFTFFLIGNVNKTKLFSSIANWNFHLIFNWNFLFILTFKNRFSKCIFFCFKSFPWGKRKKLGWGEKTLDVHFIELNYIKKKTNRKEQTPKLDIKKKKSLKKTKMLNEMSCHLRICPIMFITRNQNKWTENYPVWVSTKPYSSVAICFLKHSLPAVAPSRKF